MSFDLFIFNYLQRIPIKRQAEQKAAPAPRLFRAASPTNSARPLSAFSDLPLDQMEFDADESMLI